ncbi:Nodulin-21 [Glycine soja]
MASLGTSSNEMSIDHIEILIIHSNDIEAKPSQYIEENNIEYCQRAQWLGAVFGAKNGLVLITLLMMAVEALNEDITTMLLAGFAGLVVGASGMAIEEYVCAQLDTEVAEMKVHNNKHKEVEEDDEQLNPFQASITSAIGFSVGAAVSVLAAVFIRDYKIRLLVFAVSILAFFVFGGVGTVLGESKTPVRRTCDCDSADWRLDDYGYYFWL